MKISAQFATPRRTVGGPPSTREVLAVMAVRSEYSAAGLSCR
jgi:hypothetical protein